MNSTSAARRTPVRDGAGWLTAFVRDTTMALGEDGGLPGGRQLDMANSGLTPTGLANGLTIEVAHASSIAEAQRREIVDLCEAAFNEDFEVYFRDLSATTHVLAYRSDTLVSHACWVVRWLAPGNLIPLRTAYVEAVATAPQHQRSGYATEVMRRLAVEVNGFGLAGLSTGSPSFYERLAWERWRGPLAIRAREGLQPTPLDSAMVLRLPATPRLDVDSTLTAEWRDRVLW